MSLIYQPSGRAREYSEWAINVYRGCEHHCRYCYVPSATFTSPGTFHTAFPRKNFMEQLEKEAAQLPPLERILFCFSCDPYGPIEETFHHTRAAIEILHRYGHTVQVLTKGGGRALADLKLFTPRDAFATTLTFLDVRKSNEWEPDAASPADRIYTLQMFHLAGIPTWASLEPVIDPEQTLELIRRTCQWVDFYKVGKLNKQKTTVGEVNTLVDRIDWGKFARDVVDLLEGMGKPYYIKTDLRKYLEPV